MRRCRGLCKHCNSSIKRFKNPTQRYCSKTSCQLARKREWRRQKMTYDADYRANQQAANKRWQEKNSTYWQDYRAKNPDYVERNRIAQHARDGINRDKTSFLAKSDALIPETYILPGIYLLKPMFKTNLAKSDALRVKIVMDPGQNAREWILAKSPPYSQFKT